MQARNYYQARINKSLDFINKHLNEDIKIAQMVEAAHFSNFHFQRIYKALQNESPYETLLRLRLEKAVFHLKHHHNKKIGDIAQECGFGSIENFSRQFKNRFGITASQFKVDKSLIDSRIYQENKRSKPDISRKKWDAEKSPSFSVHLEQLSGIPLVVRRALFGADGSGLIEAYEELMSWYELAGKNRRDSRRFGMSIDDPDVTPSNLYRYDFAVQNDQDHKLIEPFEQDELPAGLYATVVCQGDLNMVGQVWDFLYRIWLPNSDYVPRHFPAIEEFMKGPEEIGWGRFDIKCRIPVEKV